MKIILFLITCFTLFNTNIIKAQKNQFDADGKRHGLWQKNFEGTNQIRYTGTFDHGNETGTFKFYAQGFPKKPSAIKEFSENGKKALVTFYTQKGNVISKGHLVNKKREGEWKYYHKDSDKLMMVENYVNDKLEGERLSYYNNGQVSEKSNFVNGKKEGQELVYSLKGVVLKEFNYKNDLLNGINKYFNGKGELTIEGMYKNNKKIGVWKYYENGKLVREKKQK